MKRHLSNLLPILSWLPEYDRSFLRPDIIAGITVTALIVPKNLGYAEIAGIPIENGLYAAAAGAILYALFGTSRQISTGPSSALAAVAASAVLATSISDKSETSAFVAAIGFVAGFIFVVMRVLKMGWISQFISKAVIVGFLFGAAIEVAVGELPKITGTSIDGENAWQEFWSWIKGLNDLHGTTLVMGAAALITLFSLRVIAPEVPGALVVVIAALVANRLFDLTNHGVAIVGNVPRGLPTPEVPSLDLISGNLGVIMLAAVAIVMIGFAQSAGDARYFAAKNNYQVDINQESLAQGAANIGAGIFQGMPVSTSLSASSLNDSAGARTPVASLTTGAAVILTLLVFAPLFSDLPKAVLGAIVIDAVVFGMMDFAELRRMFDVKRSDFLIAIAAIAGVVFAGVLTGVIIGIGLSLLWLVSVVTSPAMPLLARVQGSHVFADAEDHPEYEQFPGIFPIRLEGELFFVTSDSLEDRIRTLVQSAGSEVRAIVLDCQSINFIDSQGSTTVNQIATYLDSKNISFRLARVKPQTRAILERDGVIARLGASRIHMDVNDAVRQELEEQGRKNSLP